VVNEPVLIQALFRPSLGEYVYEFAMLSLWLNTTVATFIPYPFLSLYHTSTSAAYPTLLPNLLLSLFAISWLPFSFVGKLGHFSSEEQETRALEGFTGFQSLCTSLVTILPFLPPTSICVFFLALSTVPLLQENGRVPCSDLQP